MFKKTLLVIASGGAVALMACSSDSSDPFPDVNSFCSAKANAECTQIAPGCNAPVDACKTLRTSACTSEPTAGRTYTPSKAQACLDKINAVYSKKTFTAEDEKGVTDACERVFAGGVAKNGACAIDYDCSGDMICDKGVCGDKVVKNQGDGCNNPGEVCGSDSYCGNQGSLKFCLAKNPQAHTCDKDNPCLDTLQCIIGNGAQNGSCGPLENAGDPCDSDAACPATTTSPYCDPKQKKCEPKFGLGTQSCIDYGAH